LVAFGGVNRNVISKSFKGGEMTAFMGGAEFNFGKADIERRAELDVTVIMGGVKLIVPQNWDVELNTTNILGEVDDKRRGNGATIENTKKLVLTGTVTMGGVEIKSY
jgi:predicted membrane protein